MLKLVKGVIGGVSVWDVRSIHLSAIKSIQGGLTPFLDYQFIQCHFSKLSLGCFAEVLRATLFKQKLFYSNQRIPVGSPPNISKKGDGPELLGL